MSTKDGRHYLKVRESREGLALYETKIESAVFDVSTFRLGQLSGGSVSCPSVCQFLSLPVHYMYTLWSPALPLF